MATKDDFERLQTQLTALKDDFGRLKLTFDRILAVGGILGFILLAFSGVTAWQLPGKIRDAVIDESKKETVQQYRDAAQKASSEAQGYVSSAEQSYSQTKEFQNRAANIAKAIDDIRKSQNSVWLEASVPPNKEAVVAVLDDKTFARFDGYTTENNYCQPFTVYVTRAYTYQHRWLWL
jgi:type II secretory pathway pseudopilin PulG